LPSAEKLAKKGHYHEAAQLFEQQAICANNPYERSRDFDSAGRCYESAGELSSAVACYVKAGDSRSREIAASVCTRSGHPEYLSAAMSQPGETEDAIRLLIICSLNLLKEGKTSQAQRFGEEAFKLNSANASQLTNGFINVLNGVVENNPEKINAGIKMCQNVDFADSALADEIIPFAREELSKFSNVIVASTKKSEEERPRRALALVCPKCGAPVLNPILGTGRVKCEYCGTEIVVE
jgi:tetratricopeptide (TPR) repeat protein